MLLSCGHGGMCFADTARDFLAQMENLERKAVAIRCGTCKATIEPHIIIGVLEGLEDGEFRLKAENQFTRYMAELAEEAAGGKTGQMVQCPFLDCGGRYLRDANDQTDVSCFVRCL